MQIADKAEKNRIRQTAVLLMAAVILLASAAGCSIKGLGSDKVADLDFTVVEDEDLPVELKKLIDEKKENTLRMTYTTRDHTYMVAGYGKQQTSGYSIRVNDVYLGKNAICVDVSLIGPEAGEQVTEIPTTPYIVLKIEKRDESVIFKI